MRYILFLISCFVMQCGLLPAMEHKDFRLQKDTAQYKGSDYSNVVQVARGISLKEAFAIAEKNPDIDYFVYVKGQMMVLELPPNTPFDRSQDIFGLVTYRRFIYDSGEAARGYCRIFRHGDTVFFKKEGMWLGSAPGLADVYFKKDRE